MSVDVEPTLIAHALDWRFSLRSHPGHSLTKLLAEAARARNQAVVALPILEENEAHAEVQGTKSPGIANQLRDASVWVFVARQDVSSPPDTL